MVGLGAWTRWAIGAVAAQRRVREGRCVQPRRAMTASREGQTFVVDQARAGWLVRYVNLVKLPHTVFALPFALVGVTLASYVAPVTLSKVIWVVIAFTAARFAAMAFNRIVDRDVDALNPRTKSREIPSGALSVLAASVAVSVACIIFVISAWQ